MRSLFIWSFVLTIVLLGQQCKTFASTNNVSKVITPIPDDEITSETSGSEVELGMPTGLTITPYGNLILKLQWTPGTITGTTSDKVRYLIYRSESYDGQYERIGYTSFGDSTYLDGGGTGSLIEGTTYYYKVQAYAPNENVSSNIYYFEPVSCVATAMDIADNEFYNENDMVTYLRNGLINRDSEIVLYLWVANYTSGYHKTLYEKAVAENENLNSSSSAGDYFKYHILNYDADLTDIRLERNGLKQYKLTYWPEYYTTHSEETAVDQTLQTLIQSELKLSNTASDYEKAKAVYDYLSSHSTYDLSLRNGKSRCSAYDALINHHAVCQGFANASYKMLRELGVMNRIVIGEVYYNNEWRIHAWNYVLIDGKWYNFDATTEDHFFEDYGWISYKWFLKTDEDLGSDFRRDSTEYGSSFAQSHPMGQNSILVPIDETLSLSANNISSTTISLEWNKLNRATGYVLYRSTSPNGTYTKIKDIPGRSTADKDITNGIVYYYKVRAYEKTNGGNNYSAFSEIIPAITLETPILSSTSFTNIPDGLQITWKTTAGATSYDLYRLKDGDSTYTKIASNITTTSYIDKTVAPSTSYYYILQGCYNKNGINTTSSNSNAKKVTTNEKMNTPTITPSSGVTIKLSWNKLSGITAYDIYRSNSENGTYTYLKTTTGLSTSDTGLTAGNRYYYRITGYKTVNGTKYYTLYSDAKAAVTLATPTISTIELSDEGVLLNWSKASGADRYNIYRSENQQGNYQYITSIVGGTLSYTDSSIEEGKKYYYQVRPYKKIDGIVYYGGYSTYKSIYILGTPSVTISPSSGITMRLSWTSVSGTSAYEIYRSTDEDGIYTYIKTTTGTSTSDTNLNAGTRYYYKVRAYQNSSEGKIYSKYCTVVAVALATPQFKSASITDNGIDLSWSKASGADRYNIYRSTSENGTYEYITSILGGNLSYTDPDADQTCTYYYRVRAYKRVDGIVYYGGYSDPIKVN